VSLMGALRSAFDELESETLSDQPDARVEEDFEELLQTDERVQLAKLRRLADLERRGVYARDGYVSATAWLIHKHRMSPGLAKQLVRMARALEEMPHTRAALRDGDITTSAVRVLVDARAVDPDAFARSEEKLVDAARVQSVKNLERITAYWRQAVEREQGVDPDERLRQRRRLHLSISFLGMVRMDGDFDPEGGGTMLAAVDAVLDAEARSRGVDDGRTPAQRRADALVEIARQWLEMQNRPVVGGERPHVTVIVDVDNLRDDTGNTSEMERVGPVSPETARRIACDASIRRVVMAGASEVLDVGRRTPVWPAAIRHAVVIRDGHCQFPAGCDRPPQWCDVHHIEHWTHGGLTSKENGILLCRRHHGLIHPPSGRFRLQLEEGRPVFRRPDGSVLEDRAPP
jgi:hypothetical protein